MYLDHIRKIRKMTYHEIAENTNINENLIVDLFQDKIQKLNVTDLELVRICRYLNIYTTEFYEFTDRYDDFITFKSEMKHILKRFGDREFIKYVYNRKLLIYFWNRDWIVELMYVLAMVDKLCKENKIKINKRYDLFRKLRLLEPVFPAWVEAQAQLGNTQYKEALLQNCDPEFLKYKIIEGDIRDVC